MKSGWLVAAMLCLNASLGFSQAVDKSKPHGRACLSVLNSANGDEEALRADSEGGRGRKVRAHLDASAKCEALVAIFTRGGEPVAAWAPQYVDLPPGKEVLLPKAPVAWNWDKATGPLEAYVLFLAPGSKEGAEIRALVSAMQKTSDSAVTKLQTNKLRELIGRAKIDKAAAASPAPPEAEVAGTFRMVVGFEWRDSARAVNFSPAKPGALIFPAVK